MTPGVAPSRRPHRRRAFGVVALLVTLAMVPATAQAQAQTQAPVRVRITRGAVILDQPRGDSFVLARLPAGIELAYVQQYGRWIQVTPLPGAASPTGRGPTARPWRRGWVLATDLTFLDPQPGVNAAPAGEFMIRAFGTAGATLFAARDSFTAIFDRSWGTTLGGGVQVLLPSGVFVQGGVDRFEKTGRRVVVSGTQIFRLPTENTVRLTALQATVGFRDARSANAIGYAGAGAGLHVLEESSAALSDTLRQTHLGFHVLGGAEYRLAPFVWLAGEAQWTTVPKGLGAPGVAPAFNETDLGGTTFRVKVLIGR